MNKLEELIKEIGEYAGNYGKYMNPETYKLSDCWVEKDFVQLRTIFDQRIILLKDMNITELHNVLEWLKNFEKDGYVKKGVRGSL